MIRGDGVRQLAKEHILDLKPYVPGKPVDEVKREYNLSEIIKLASNENPLGTSKYVREKLKNEDMNFNVYPDGACYELRGKLAAEYDVAEENFIFGDGTDEVLEMLFIAYIQKGDEVIFGTPSFVEYGRYATISGGTKVEVGLTDDYRYDLENMKSKINEKTKMVIICNPNNPTGTIVDTEELDRFIQGISDDIIVVVDEAYYEYAAPYENYPDAMDYIKKGYKNVVSLRTFSKAYGLAGLRVGFGVADKEIIEILEKVRLPFNVTSISQKAAIYALEDKEHIQESVKVNEEGKEYLYSELRELNIEFADTYSNFIYIKVPRSGKEIFEDMMKQGVIIRAMAGNFVRVTIGTMEENIRFIKTLKGVI